MATNIYSNMTSAQKENERKYLTNLQNSGNAGEKEWASTQLKQLNSTSSSSSSSSNKSSSNKSSSSSNKSSSSSYTPLGSYNDSAITGSDKDLLTQYGNAYNAAKAAGDQKGMDAAHAAAEALRNKYGYSGGVDGSQYIYSGLPEVEEDFEFEEERPTYESQYNAKIDAILDEYLNRDKFSYDVTKDPLYEQYKAQYLREGQRAMNDTLASVAAGAGGMNSYAVTAAQQANNYYNSQLGDKIPELYQQAYGMYLDDIDRQIQDLNILQDMDNNQYNRYRDTMADWRDDKNFAYTKYRDEMSDFFNNRNFAYGVNRDNILDERYENEWDYGVGRDNILDSRYDNEWNYNTSKYDSETAYNRAMEFLSMGVMPSASVLQSAGISQNEAQAYIDRIKALESMGSTSGGSGRTGVTSGGGTTSTKKDTTETEKERVGTVLPDNEQETLKKRLDGTYKEATQPVENFITKSMEAFIMQQSIDMDSVKAAGITNPAPFKTIEEKVNDMLQKGQLEAEVGANGKLKVFPVSK